MGNQRFSRLRLIKEKLNIYVLSRWWFDFMSTPEFLLLRFGKNSSHFVKETFGLSVSVHWEGNNDIRERRAGERKAGRAVGRRGRGEQYSSRLTRYQWKELPKLLSMWTHRHSSIDIWHQEARRLDYWTLTSLQLATPRLQPIDKWKLYAKNHRVVWIIFPRSACCDSAGLGPVIWRCGTGATGLMKRRCRNVQHQHSSTWPQPKIPPLLFIETARISRLGCK